MKGSNSTAGNKGKKKQVRMQLPPEDEEDDQ